MESNGPTREQITEQAADWLVRLDAGSADAEAFEAWRGADPRHASAFAQVAAAWKRTGDLRGMRAPEPAAPSVVAPEPALPAHEQPERVGRRTMLRALAASGIGVVALGSAGLLLTTRRASAETARGERRTVALPDGSRVELNTSTRIEWRFGERRELWMDSGEAGLAVADDLARPMLLHSGGVQAAIESGRYNLRAENADLRLTVFAGRARLEHDGRSAVARAGQQAQIDAGALAVRDLTPDALDAALAWRRGEIHFDGMTLAQAAAEYNRYLPRRMVVADPQAAGLRLGGRFLIDEPSDFLRALAEGFGVESRIEGDRILLRYAAAPRPAAPQQK